jgi:signal transduction histidine kinase
VPPVDPVHGWRILTATALVLVGGALIVTLWLALERRHRRIQARLAGQLRFETLVSEISRTFAGLPAVRVDEHIRECLRRMVLFLDVHRGSLWLPVGGGSLLRPSHVFALEGTPPPDSIDLDKYPHLRRVTAQGLPFTFDHVSRLPNDTAAEREAFERLGITSYAALPLRIGEHTLGFLTFVKIGGERQWPPDVIEQVRTLAELFANALSRQEAASALQESEAFTNAVLAALPGETAIVDAEGVIVQVNEAWDAFVDTLPFDAQVPLSVGGNYLKALQRPVRMPLELARKARELLVSVLHGQHVEAALEYPSMRGAEDRYFELRVRRVARPGGGAAVMHFDVTARRRAEAAAKRHLGEIAHLDRVAGMGQLATSLAHELNQPLTAILTNAQAAQRLLSGGEPDLAELRETLSDIVHDDQRAAEVIRRMRQLLRKDELTRLPIDVNELTANTISLVANDALLHYVTLEFVPARGLPAVHGDLIQIQQVILNLLSNAITAAASGPTAQRRVLVWTTAAVGGSVELGVHDSGKGIPSSDLSRLFEPFFTTKAEGLGMGLAISRSIVEAHGGQIDAENDPAGGAAFRVRLPAAPAERT